MNTWELWATMNLDHHDLYNTTRSSIPWLLTTGDNYTFIRSYQHLLQLQRDKKQHPPFPMLESFRTGVDSICKRLWHPQSLARQFAPDKIIPVIKHLTILQRISAPCPATNGLYNDSTFVNLYICHNGNHHSAAFYPSA